ncbi:hypothetical protein NKDENANG_01612 [Candidatus Entotheonellaceae bacterium PAL068K]
MIKDLSARATSVRSGRTDVEFRGFPPAEVEAIKKQMVDRVTIRYPKAMIHWGVAVNVDHKPLDDERVRKALTLAINHYDMADILAPLSGLETVGALIHPDAPWTLSPEELQQLPGFGKDHQVQDLQRAVLEKAWWLPGLWWTRIEVRSSRIKNYEPPHSHWMNRRLEDVWLAKK